MYKQECKSVLLEMVIENERETALRAAVRTVLEWLPRCVREARAERPLLTS